MKNNFFIFITIMALCICFTWGETILSDVTHDGIDDEINIGELSVVVVDGKTGKRYVVESNNEFLIGVDVVDLLTPVGRNELAVQISEISAEGHFTILYGYDGGKFNQLSEVCPGEIMVADDGNMWGWYSIYEEDFGYFQIPVPLSKYDHYPYLRMPNHVDRITNVVTVKASNTRDITIELTTNVLAVIYIVVKEKDVRITLTAGGEILAEGLLEASDALVYDYQTRGNTTLTISIDNSYSLIIPKVIFYSIDMYKR